MAAACSCGDPAGVIFEGRLWCGECASILLNDTPCRTWLEQMGEELPPTGRLISGPAGTCRYCGCRDDRACWDDLLEQPCVWFLPDLCSACALPLLVDAIHGEAA